MKKLLMTPLFAAGALLVSLVENSAATIITEDFDAPLNGIPSGWSLTLNGSPDNSQGNVVGIKQISPEAGNGLRFYRTGSNSTNQNGTVYYRPTLSEQDKISDFSAEITLRMGNTLGTSTTTGYVVRSQNLAYNPSGYYVAVGGTSGGTTLAIYRNPVGHADPGNVLVSFATIALLANTDYTLQVSAIGSTITASLWDTGITPERLAFVEYEDADITAGYFGLRTGFGNTNNPIYYSDLTLNVIPEPSAGVLLILGGTLLMRHLRRRNLSNT